ncbi:MAG: YciI family protein [Alphaproteobacteria bacterium]
MFVVLLRFSANKDRARQLMDGHNAWIRRGFDEDVFLLAGTLQPSLGGSIVAHNTSLPELQSRVSEDPFVAEDVVAAEILEISPARTDRRLDFLVG